MSSLPPFLTRRRILQGTAAIAASSLLEGCTTLSTPYVEKPPIPTPIPIGDNPQPTPPGPITSATIVVTANPAGVGALNSTFVGLSYEKSSLYEPLFTGSNANLIALFELLGTGILRIGGNSVDRNIWNSTGAGQTPGQIAPPDIDALAAFVTAAQWQVIYGINLGGSATGAQTPALAAAEVAYVSQKLGPALLGIEIGNECDLYGNTGSYYAGNWSLSQFENLWTQYRTAILATTPGVLITGPASASNESSWTVPFGQTVAKNEISLLTQHYYRGDGQSPSSTDALLITPDPTLITDLKTLQAGAMGIGVPFRISECNSFYNGGADGVSDSYASSLWVIDFMFNCLQTGAAGINFHGGGNGTGYTPIADSNGVVVAARPEFYGITFFTLTGGGLLYNTAVAAGSLNVTAYALKGTTSLSLLIVNKDPTLNLNTAITLPQAFTTGTLIEMTQLSPGATTPSLSATSGVTIQGATINPDGSFTPGAAYTLGPSGNTVDCWVPALSAVLLQLS